MQKRSLFRVMFAAAVFAVVALAAFGCGSSGPKAAVEDFMAAAKDKNCEKMVDLMDLKALDDAGAGINKDELVNSCKAESGLGDVVSYKILEEKTDGDKSEIKVEVTTKENDKETTESDTLTLNKRDGAWKISLL